MVIIVKRKLFYLILISAVMFFAGCDNAFYDVYNDFTGPVDAVALPKTASVVIYTTEQLKASVYPAMTENKEVTWEITSQRDALGNPSSGVASIDASGKITGSALGSAMVQARTVEGGFTAECTVTVVPTPIPVTEWSFANTEETITILGQVDLSPVPVPANATSTEKSWNSSNSSVATVDATGRVTGVSPGTAVITVESATWGVTGTCVVNVISGILIESVTLSSSSHSTTKKEIIQLTATVLPADATNKSFSWNSSNEAVATVDANGLVSIFSPGNAAITASTKDGSNITKFFNLTASGYYVTYDGNHNSIGTAPTDSLAYLEGESFTAKTKESLAYHDRELLGWNTAADASGTGCIPGGTVTMVSGGMTLYANWQPFELRDKGPAGGWIFVAKQDYSGGWRYMEVSSSDLPSVYWSNGSVETGAVDRSIGTGKTNTQKMISIQGVNAIAAQSCKGMIDGYDDWFLPSVDELGEVWKVLVKSPSTPGFAWVELGNYWTSTEVSSTHALFFGGYHPLEGASYPKNNNGIIRPVRSF